MWSLITYISLYLGKYCGTRFVDDNINFFNDIKISLVVSVFDSSSAPRHIRQLSRWQCVTHTVFNTYTHMMDGRWMIRVLRHFKHTDSGISSLLERPIARTEEIFRLGWRLWMRFSKLYRNFGEWYQNRHNWSVYVSLTINNESQSKHTGESLTHTHKVHNL